MDLFQTALDEIALEGLDGTTIENLWKLIIDREPKVDCAIDQWTKPYLWTQLAESELIYFVHVDFDGEKKSDVPIKKAERLPKMPNFWIYDHRDGTTGYSTTFYYRNDVTDIIRNAAYEALLTLEQVVERWGDHLRIIAVQDYRRRLLFGPTNPPIIEEVTPVRYIILEIIGKGRWEGFMQADFQKHYGIDPRTSFHHVKLLVKLHLVTKQSVLISKPVNDVAAPVPPKSTKMLHLSKFSNVFTNNIQKAAAKICRILEEAPDSTMERSQLKKMCGDMPQFKKIRQWLFHSGYIRYIVNGRVWKPDNMSPIQVTHFRACRPCYVLLVKKFQISDVDDEKEDDFLDYIENCDDIEPRLVYEETLHHQAYRVMIASREKGITMKKLAEVMCIPYTMARSFIRYFDSSKIGRIVSIDHLKLKVQKIVAIQFLHQSETVQKLKSNKMRIEHHKACLKDEKPKIKSEPSANQTLSEQNLRLADDLGLKRVPEKSKLSLRHLARKNYVLDALREQPVWEGTNELYKNLIFQEDSQRCTQGVCCRKTFKRVLQALEKDGQIKKYTIVLDEKIKPLLSVTFYCAAHITAGSQEYLNSVERAKLRYSNQEKRREIKRAIKDQPKGKNKKNVVPTDDLANIAVKKEEEKDEELTDTDDEEFIKTIGLSTSRSMENRYFTFGRFQKLHILHLYLWKLVYGTPEDLTELEAAGGPSTEFVDLIQSRHIWLPHAHGLPVYKEGKGWFNVGDIISLMPIEVTCRVLGIKCWFVRIISDGQQAEDRYQDVDVKIQSNTLIKYLDDPKRRLLRMTDLPPRLKYKMLLSPAKKKVLHKTLTSKISKPHLDNAVDLLVFLAQMGLVAVSPSCYPKVRQEITLFLRKEAIITDTRFTEKTYCHTQLPEGMENFPVNRYNFKSLADVEKYWTDLQFICLNTPLGLNRLRRGKQEAENTSFNEEEESLGKAGIGRIMGNPDAKRRMYRSFTILRDFQQYYEKKDFTKLEPVVFGNGLGAGGLDSCFFGHLVKNWRYGKKVTARPSRANSLMKSVKNSVLNSAAEAADDPSLSKDGTEETSSTTTGDKPGSSSGGTVGKKMVVSNLIVQARKGGKGLKRKLASTTGVMTKKMKMERKKYFDKLIAKRFEHVREKVRITEIKKKAMRKPKSEMYAQNHDDKDREALRRMKGQRVSFTEREDAYILLTEIVKTMMKLSDKGQPLEKEHPKVLWHAIRDILHKDVPESRDKTWNAIERRARYIKKYPHSLIVFKTCVAELEQDKEFMASLQCTKENWREKVVQAFDTTREIYSRHFTQQVELKDFPNSLTELYDRFNMEYAHEEEKFPAPHKITTEKGIRISVLQDLIHNSLTAQKLTSYIPAVAFKVFDAYPPSELNEAFEFYKENKLISRYRVDVPRRRSLPISTMTYNLSTTYFRIFEPSMPLRIFLMARNFYVQVRDGKQHVCRSKEKEILKMDQIAPQGTCSLDFSCLQGGHVAYLLSAMINKKVYMNFKLPEEITINDEEHFKRLKEGNLNFQRVAFEQRIKRGESLVQRRRNLSVQDEEASSNANHSTLDPTNTSKTLNIAKKILSNESSPTKTLEKNNDDNSVEEEPSNISLVHNKAKDMCSNTHVAKDNNSTADDSISDIINDELPCSSKDVSSLIHNKAKDVYTDSHAAKANNSTADESISDIINDELPCSSKDVSSLIHNKAKDVYTDSHAAKANNSTADESISDIIKDELPCSSKEISSYRKDMCSKTHAAKANNSTADDSISDIIKDELPCSSKEISSYRPRYDDISLNGPLQGNMMLSMTSRPNHMACAFSKFDIASIQKFTVPSRINLHRDFDYTSKASSSKQAKTVNAKLVNIFKEGKMHASRTALSMHRSLGDEKLMPTNAMNTHDALVINPMNVNACLFTSPFRHFGKLKRSTVDKEVIERFRNSPNEGYTGGLNLEEYCEVLRDDLKYKEEDVDIHRRFLDKIKASYVLGMNLRDAETLVESLTSDTRFLHDWDNHLQTMLNFRMVYRVGHYENRLVHNMYYSTWCFRAPQEKETSQGVDVKNQMSSDFEPHESSDMKKDETKITDKSKDELHVEESRTTNNGTTTATEENTQSENETKISDPAVPLTKTVTEDETIMDDDEVNEANKGPLQNSTKRSYKVCLVRPWLKLDGELNGVLLKRFQETMLIYIMQFPGVTQKQVLKHFNIVLKAAPALSILEFLEINGCIKKHRVQKKKATLFSPFNQSFGSSLDDDGETYYVPTTPSLLNMMDLNR